MTIRILLNEIKSNLNQICSKLNYPTQNFVVEEAKPGFGDITSNMAFLLSKAVKKKPNEIAKIISEEYKTFLSKLVKQVEAHPTGYLNFLVNYDELSKIILMESRKKDYGTINIGNNSKTIVEHTSVNPNKALHIGHVRNVVIGDSLARILSKVNYDVKILNYVDDSGLQVADIVVGFKYLEIPTEPPNQEKFDQYCGDLVYVKTTQTYTTDPKLEERRNQVLKELEDSSSETLQFAKKITRRVLKEQLKTCWRLDATYDCLNFESQIIQSNLWKIIFEKMKQTNLVQLEKQGKNAGCWVFKLKNEDDKVLVRSDGTATYIAKDIPYAAWKLGIVDDPFYYEQYDVQYNKKILWQTKLEKNTEKHPSFTGKKVITVIDSRQARLQKIVTSLMEHFDTNPTSYVHLGYESVTLSAETAKSLGAETDGKQIQMSGRKGIYVNADFVLDTLSKKSFDEAQKRNKDFDKSTLLEIAESVAVGTLRYEMIKQDLDKIITFDMNTSLSLEGDTASYIQYAFARAERILEKATLEPNFENVLGPYETSYEINLIKKIGKFDIQIEDAANNLSPKVIARYCYDLAVAFNGFYEHVKVLFAGEESLVNSRLCLVYCFKETISKALNLLGIPTLNKM